MMGGNQASPAEYPRIDLAKASPADLVTARLEAFAHGNFAFIYDSYHPDSFFRQQFPDRTAYIAYAQATLAAEFEIVENRVLKGRRTGSDAEIIFYLVTRFQGERQESFELARLLQTDDGWRYHSSQKLCRAEFRGAIGEIDWSDFEKARDKVVF